MLSIKFMMLVLISSFSSLHAHSALMRAVRTVALQQLRIRMWTEHRRSYSAPASHEKEIKDDTVTEEVRQEIIQQLCRDYKIDCAKELILVSTAKMAQIGAALGFLVGLETLLYDEVIAPFFCMPVAGGVIGAVGGGVGGSSLAGTSWLFPVPEEFVQENYPIYLKKHLKKLSEREFDKIF